MEDTELNKLIDQKLQAITEFRGKFEEFQKGILTKGEFAESEKKVQARLDEIETKMKRPAQASEQKEESPERKAFGTWLRKGQISPDEAKVMTISDPTTGGYLAPNEYVREILKTIVEFSPLRSLARIRTTSNKSIEVPKRTTTASASWVAEIGTRSETTNPKYGLETIPTHELYALAKVSMQDLEDSAFNLESEINAEFSEQFGVAEGAAFISGSGPGKPEGILTNASITGFTGTTTSAKIVADDLKQVFYLLKSDYARNATWLWNRSSTLAISLLKDTVSGNYLWQYGLQEGEPANVLGRPFIECTDMPVEAASAKAVAVGDFRRGYMIVDRIQIEVMRDPYSSKSTGCIEISARKRVGGQVVMPEAIKIYTLKA